MALASLNLYRGVKFMYPYYSQPSPQGNPYQTGLQNVKGFFRKPLILIVAIVYSLFALSTIITRSYPSDGLFQNVWKQL